METLTFVGSNGTGTPSIGWRINLQGGVFEYGQLFTGFVAVQKRAVLNDDRSVTTVKEIRLSPLTGGPIASTVFSADNVAPVVRGTALLKENQYIFRPTVTRIPGLELIGKDMEMGYVSVLCYMDGSIKAAFQFCTNKIVADNLALLSVSEEQLQPIEFPLDDQLPSADMLTAERLLHQRREENQFNGELISFGLPPFYMGSVPPVNPVRVGAPANPVNPVRAALPMASPVNPVSVGTSVNPVVANPVVAAPKASSSDLSAEELLEDERSCEEIMRDIFGPPRRERVEAVIKERKSKLRATLNAFKRENERFSRLTEEAMTDENMESLDAQSTVVTNLLQSAKEQKAELEKLEHELLEEDLSFKAPKTRKAPY